MHKNLVIFKGRRDGILILLDDKADFETLKAQLYIKINDAKKFFNSGKTAITFSGRKLTEQEEKELLAIINEEIDISFVTDGKTDGNLTDSAHNDNYQQTLLPSENITLYHRGSLRSGQMIHYHGSVVVIGDVNPGAEIIADGNVVILGSLRGMVHAGASGNDDCFISALDFVPTQLRISGIITYIPKDMTGSKRNKSKGSYAFIQDGKIYISPLEN